MESVPLSGIEERILVVAAIVTGVGTHLFFFFSGFFKHHLRIWFFVAFFHLQSSWSIQQ